MRRIAPVWTETAGDLVIRALARQAILVEHVGDPKQPVTPEELADAQAEAEAKAAGIRGQIADLRAEAERLERVAKALAAPRRKRRFVQRSLDEAIGERKDAP